jgi:hypothetical protein
VKFLAFKKIFFVLFQAELQNITAGNREQEENANAVGSLCKMQVAALEQKKLDPRSKTIQR